MAIAQVPDDDPLRIAWKSYTGTDEYKNSFRWPMRTALAQAISPEVEAEREADSILLHQRKQHVHASLWAAFTAGYMAAEVN
jgi:hypothetical protein